MAPRTNLEPTLKYRSDHSEPLGCPAGMNPSQPVSVHRSIVRALWSCVHLAFATSQNSPELSKRIKARVGPNILIWFNKSPSDFLSSAAWPSAFMKYGGNFFPMCLTVTTASAADTPCFFGTQVPSQFFPCGLDNRNSKATFVSTNWHYNSVSPKKTNPYVAVCPLYTINRINNTLDVILNVTGLRF